MRFPISAAMLVGLIVLGCACGGPRSSGPATPPPDAATLLSEVAEVYASAGSYSDRGTSKTTIGGTPTSATFSTAFVRPDRFRFELRDGGDTRRTTLIWLADGAAYTDWYLRPDEIVEDDDLASTLAAASGFSSQTSALVPALLMRQPSSVVATMPQARVTGERTAGGRACWTVVSIQRAGGGERTVTLSIDKESRLVRRYEDVIRVSQDGRRALEGTHVIEYEPRLDIDIHPDSLRGRDLANAIVKPRGAARWIGVFFERGSTRLQQVFHGGPAALAGLQAGDRIVSFAGIAVGKPSQVIREVNRRSPGDVVELAIERSDAQLVLSITIGERPETEALQRAQLIDRPAPPLELATLDGGRMSLAALRGRVVVLDFWATWCGPCRAALPHLLRWHQQLGPRGLTIVGITEEDVATVQPFVQQHAMSYTIALDPPQDAWRSFLVSGIPTTIIIDRDGIVRRVAVGLDDVSSIEATLVDLLD